MFVKKLWKYLVFFIFILSIYYFVLNWSKNKTQTQASVGMETYNPAQKLSEVQKKYYKVIRIVDGDTFVVSLSGKEDKVRMLGINTPESVAKNRPDECFGKEASLKTKELLLGQNVLLEFDITKPKKDEYGRLLIYVFREDGLFVSEELIKIGFAYEYTYNREKYKYQKDFKEAEAYAKKNKLGLWSESTCGGSKEIK
jgi:micrococcal nuclease